MIDYMDEIVEAVKRLAIDAKDITKEIITMLADAGATAIIILTKALLLITAPAWVLPYAIFRDLQQDNNDGRCEKPDCKNCPFPPCDERRGGE